MRITILAAGTRGDVQPYIALALGLQQAGHPVRIAADTPFADWIHSFGLDFAPLQGNLRDLMEGEAMQELLAKSHTLRLLREINGVMQQVIEGFTADIWNACQGSEAIIFSLVAVAGYGAAEALGVPTFWAPLQPMSRTRAFPSILAPNGRRLAGPLNWLSHLAEEQLVWQASRRFINNWRRETLHIPPFPFLGPFARIEKEHLPTLYGYSPAVLPKPADWGNWLHVTGYWFLDRSPDWQPPAALLDFLNAGPPPVYIGFGSMSNREPEKLTGLVVEALALAGQRGILVSGWGGLGGLELPPTIFQAEAIPHDWLFPQVAAVVHHGGAGTTAAGLRAGKPTVAVPFSFDQPFWAQRVYELGAAVQPIPRRRLAAERLAAAIRQAVDDPALRERAAAVGNQVRGEDGVARAVEAFQESV